MGNRIFWVCKTFQGEVSLVSSSSEDAIEIVVSLFTAEVHEKSVMTKH